MSRPHKSKLSTRVAAGVVVCVLVLSLLDLFSLQRSLRTTITRAHDSLLAAATYSIADSLHLEQGRIQATFPLAMQEAFESAGGGSVLFWIGELDGSHIAGDERLRQVVVPQQKAGSAISYFDTTFERQSMRASHLLHPLERSEGQRVAQIVVVHSDEVRRAALRDATTSALWRQTLFLVVAALAIVVVVRRLLRPIDDLKQQVDARDPVDEAPFLPVRLEELNPVVVALNGLLARLLSARQQQERFVANASHQLRTPLSVLKVLLQSALREPETSPARLADMLSAVDRAGRLTDQLLSLARIHQGGHRVALAQADLRAVLDEAIVELSPLIADKGLRFSFDAVPTGQVNGAAWMMGELLRNLLLNATQHSPRGGELQVSVSRHGDAGVAVDIIDAGPGIAAEQLKTVFEPFASVPGRSGGSGLGLTICKEIADAIGAEVLLQPSPCGPGLMARVVFRSVASSG